MAKRLSFLFIFVFIFLLSLSFISSAQFGYNNLGNQYVLQGGDTVRGNYNFTGNVTINQLNVMNVTTLNINGSLIPSINNNFDLGSSSFNWRDLYLSRNVDVGGNLSVNTNTLFVNSNNNRVGIGTVTPGGKLGITNSIGFDLQAGTSGTIGQDNILLLNGGNGGGNGKYGPGISFGYPEDGINVRRYASIASVQTTSDSDQIGLSFITHPGATSTDSLVEQMRITASGNVGINTITPQNRLNIIGDGNFTGNLTTNFLKTTNLGNGAELIRFAIEREWAFRQMSTGASTRLDLHAFSDVKEFTISSPSSKVVFTAVVADASITNRIYLIPNGGFVGINTSTPKNTLNVFGTANITSNLSIKENLLFVNAETNLVGINTSTPSYPLEVNTNESGISIWSQANVSATGYNTRTSIFDKSKGKAINYIKDADFYKTNGKIDHTKFYGYVGELNITDYSKPVNVTIENEIINEETNETKIVTNIVTTYPYVKQVGQVSLNMEIDVLRQALFELNEENSLIKSELCRKDNSYLWCIK